MNLKNKRGAIEVNSGGWVVMTGDVDDSTKWLEEFLQELSSLCDVVDGDVVHPNGHATAQGQDGWENGKRVRFEWDGLHGECSLSVSISGENDKSDASCAKVDANGGGVAECRVNGIGNVSDRNGCFVVGDADHKLVWNVGKDNVGSTVDVVPVFLGGVDLQLLEVCTNLVMCVLGWQISCEGVSEVHFVTGDQRALLILVLSLD